MSAPVVALRSLPGDRGVPCHLREPDGTRVTLLPVRLELLPSGVDQVVVYLFAGAWERLPTAVRRRLHALLDERPAQRWRPLAWWSVTPLRRCLGPIARGGEVHLAVLHELASVETLGRRVELPTLHELLIERVDGDDHD
jgi:hypothetical protein